MDRVSVRLAKALSAKLDAAAKSRRTSKAAVVRAALQAYLDKEELSAYDLVAHLAGCVEGGPGDLSTNPKYMEGFGRDSLD